MKCLIYIDIFLKLYLLCFSFFVVFSHLFFCSPNDEEFWSGIVIGCFLLTSLMPSKVFMHNGVGFSVDTCYVPGFKWIGEGGGGRIIGKARVEERMIRLVIWDGISSPLSHYDWTFKDERGDQFFFIRYIYFICYFIFEIHQAMSLSCNYGGRFVEQIASDKLKPHSFLSSKNIVHT